MNDVKLSDDHSNYVTEAAQSALTNPLIVEQIAKYLPLRDLKQLCIVSKCWQDATITPLRKSSHVKLSRANGTSKFVSYLESAGDDKVWKLYANFKLHSIDFSNPANMQPFWTLLGAQIRNLTLSCCDFPNKDNLRQIIFERCPNMKQLCLEQVLISGEYGNEPAAAAQDAIYGVNYNVSNECLIVDPCFQQFSGITWKELFTHFPSIETFGLTSACTNSEETDAELYQAICDIRRQDSGKLMLKEISVLPASDYDSHPPIPPSLKDLLLNSGLHLEKVSIILNRVRNKRLIKKMLAQQSKTLRNLVLDGKRCKIFLQPTNCFPSQGLYTLTKLTLHSGVFTSLGFLQFTPNLKKLSLLGGHAKLLTGTSRSDVETCRHEGCRELDVSDLVSVEELKKLVEMLPNIDRLKMSLDYDTLEFVCSKWKNLRSLMVCNCVLSDEEIVAFDSEIDFGHEKRVTLKVDDGKPRVSSINNLKHLRRLSLVCVEGLISFRQGPSYEKLMFTATRFGMHKQPAIYDLATGENDFPRKHINLRVQFLKTSYRITSLFPLVMEYNLP